MPRKTFKIGEYCKGGIITVECNNKTISVIGKEWDFNSGSNRGSNQSNAKEFTRLELSVGDGDVYRKVDLFLNDLTTSYYADMIMKWVTTKIKIKNNFSNIW